MRHARRTLIKEVRISRALGWFTEMLPVPTVVLVRHPCAVVDSMLRATQEDWNRWTPAQVSAAIQATLPDIALADTDERAVLLAAVWAADVRSALEAVRGHDRALVVTYEHLYQQPHAELRRIGALLGLDPTPADADRPSLTTLDSSPLRQGADPLTSWQSRLAPATVRAILDVAHRLGVPFYTTNPLPNPTAIDRALT